MAREVCIAPTYLFILRDKSWLILCVRMNWLRLSRFLASLADDWSNEAMMDDTELTINAYLW
jgi:hypothetical protein